MSYPPPPGAGAPGGFPPPGGGYPPQGGFAPPAAQPTNGMAIAALITGILTIVTCLFPLGLVAIVLGFIALGKAKNLNGSGKGMAIGGIASGLIGLVSGTLLVFLVFLAADAADEQLDDATCRFERTSLEAAVNAYVTVEGSDPASQADLVREGYLNDEIPEYDFSVSGGTVTTTAVDGEGCE